MSRQLPHAMRRVDPHAVHLTKYESAALIKMLSNRSMYEKQIQVLDDAILILWGSLLPSFEDTVPGDKA